ncbi:MAG TPA: YebC/PmpR family DNA-binding transcriptional regulator [Rhodanobacteraceae bacterium]|jgi:YebC/PmpR family DNA-binding regulatory protein|nr:YebC/PmpR family DNA-binding transcriptional regulator [Rhodanobacteraceae bacterium]
MGRGPTVAGRKNAQDAKRGQVFTKLVREIMVAARTGGGDVNGNARLRTAVDKAIAASMPKDNIERAIKKATGELEGVVYEELHFEGYAAGGVAVLVECVTDNRQRAVSDVRHTFAKLGGNLGTDGSVAYLFNRIGVLSYAAGVSEDKLTDAAIEAGAEDVKVWPEDGQIDVITTPETFEAVRDAMEHAGLKPDHAEITMRAALDVPVAAENVEAVQNLLARLEELDDVQNVYSNADLPAG